MASEQSTAGTNVGDSEEKHCPDCGSENIRHEREHGDTICIDCGWFTEHGGPNEAVDWGEIHAK